MVQRVRIDTLCDLCDHEGRETLAKLSATITLRDQTIELEWCEEHEEKRGLNAALETLVEFGRPKERERPAFSGPKRAPRNALPPATKDRAYALPRDYPCEEPGCGKVFARPGNRDHHMNEHLGLTPFKCTECEKEWPSPNARNTHVYKAHNAKK